MSAKHSHREEGNFWKAIFGRRTSTKSKGRRKAVVHDSETVRNEGRRTLLTVSGAATAVAALAVMEKAITGEQPAVQDTITTMNLDIPDAPTRATPTTPLAEERTTHLTWEEIVSPHKPAPTTRKIAKATPQKAEAKPVRRATRTPIDATGIRKTILSIGQRYFGIPYLYGGTNPSTGLDCSAYTRLVYSGVGLHLPRTSKEQYAYCTPVSKPEPGDLVFFGSPIHHVGIVSRPGMMYNAPHKGAVVGEDPIYSEYTKYARHPHFD